MVQDRMMSYRDVAYPSITCCLSIYHMYPKFYEQCHNLKIDVQHFLQTCYT